MSGAEYKNLFSDLELAYIRLKSYVYYDNTLTELRARIAAYEMSGIKSQLYRLTKEVLTYKHGNKASINNKLLDISYNIKPKKIASAVTPGSFDFVTNENTKKEYRIKDFIH